MAGEIGKTNISSRQRVIDACNHLTVDRVPVDLGGTLGSGAHVSVVADVRRRLGLDEPGQQVKVVEPYQTLGEIAADLREILGIDVVNLPGPKNFFGFENKNWKPWETFDGTEVLVPELYNTIPESDGSILMYPEGDRAAPASARMPRDGYYFDTIIRQPPIDDAKLRPEDNLEEFKPVTEEELRIYESQAADLYQNTELAITAGFPGTAFGDIALVAAPFMKFPRGIRDIEEWYVSTITRREFIFEVFSRQVEIALENLECIYQAVGNRVHVVWMDGTDFGTQTSLFCSPESYRLLYQPFHKKLNEWIHQNTEWKTLKHCCGACEPLIEGFIEAEFDILNPVQTSATGMEPQHLVDTFGERIVFWGGGVDTQKSLPFGTPEEVFEQVRERLQVFGRNPGFVFAAIHNIQCNTPAENVLAIFKSLGRSFDEIEERTR